MAIDPNAVTETPSAALATAGLPRIPVPGDGNPRVNATGKVYTRYAFLGNPADYQQPQQQQQQQQQPRQNRYMTGNTGGGLGGAISRFGRWSPAGVLLGGILVPSDPGAEAYLNDVVPQDAHETDLKNQALEAIRSGEDGASVRRDLHRDIGEHRDKKKKEQETDSSGGRGPDNNVQVRGNPCKIGKKGDNKCPSGQQAHHIVPDFALRYGRPGNADLRVPNTPSYNDGPTICVQGGARTAGSEHNRIQNATDSAVARLDDGTGSARLGDVLREAKRTAGEAIPECKEQMDRAVDEAFKGADPNTLVRTYNGPLREYNIPSLTPR